MKRIILFSISFFFMRTFCEKFILKTILKKIIIINVVNIYFSYFAFSLRFFFFFYIYISHLNLKLRFIFKYFIYYWNLLFTEPIAF